LWGLHGGAERLRRPGRRVGEPFADVLRVLRHLRAGRPPPGRLELGDGDARGGREQRHRRRLPGSRPGLRQGGVADAEAGVPGLQGRGRPGGHLLVQVSGLSRLRGAARGARHSEHGAALPQVPGHRQRPGPPLPRLPRGRHQVHAAGRAGQRAGRRSEPHGTPCSWGWARRQPRRQ
ncbi:unnamed protein product, partial [Polarella glacialis]